MLGLELAMIFVLSQKNGLEIFFRGDGRDYENLANNLIHYKTLAITPAPPYWPTNFRTPTYPFWLALIILLFKSLKPAVFIGATVFAFSAPLVYLIAKTIFSEKIAFISAILFTVEPWALYQSGFLSAEQIFMPIFLLSVYLFICYLKSSNRHYIYYSTFLLGVAVLTRPVALFFVAIFLFLAFISELKISFYQSIKMSALIFLIFIAVLSPWFIRNKLVLNSWQFSSASGIRVFGDYIMLKQYLNKVKPGELIDIYEESRRLVGIKSDWETMSVENSQKMSQVALQEIRANFGIFTVMYFKNIAMYFVKNSYGNIFFDLGFSGSNIQSKIGNYLKRGLNPVVLIREATLSAKILIILFFFWPLITLLGVIGFLNIFKKNWRNLSFWFLVLWIIYFSVLTAIARDLSRYRLAIHAPLFIFAVLGFYKIKNYFFKS